MRRSRINEEQIIAILKEKEKEKEAGMARAMMSRCHGISSATGAVCLAAIPVRYSQEPFVNCITPIRRG